MTINPIIKKIGCTFGVTVLPKREYTARKLQCLQPKSANLAYCCAIFLRYLGIWSIQKYRYYPVGKLTIAGQDLDGVFGVFDSDNNDDYKNWCKEIPPSGPLQVLWHIVDCGWPEQGWDFPFKSSNRAPTVFRCHFILDHLASFCRGYLDSCMQWIGWLFAVDALVVARCVCSINTQAPINLAQDDHWPERRAGLFYWLVRASLQHCTITYDRLLLPKMSIKGSKGNPGSGHTKISTLNSSGAVVFTRFTPACVVSYSPLVECSILV